jgi:hypothetical protein
MEISSQIEMSRPVADAFALLSFVAVGALTHDASAVAFVRDALCILGGWFAAALAIGLYTRETWRRLPVTWFAGISGGVLVRAAFVGHFSPAFYGVALAFTALFVSIVRAALALRR